LNQLDDTHSKWISGLVWLFTCGLFLLGLLYDLWTLHEQIDDVNSGQF
jgi:hypothetical protein